MNDLQPERIGFYPISAQDYLEPLRILKTHVDQLIFCDIACVPSSPRGLRDIRRVIDDEGLPQASFLLGDVLSVLEWIKPVDIFFLRRDSSGEGGSGLALLHANRIHLVLNVIKPNGLLVIDRPNGFLWLTRMLSGNSPLYPVGERILSLSSSQPWADQGLFSVTVT